ncbi:uncharacterized protein LOC112574800 isoform X2 [Pomacea canaliculata]|uniref:uncharacterized protein LOC112574800 isoform X2 n=1 Tax=Pomacea canaliculata TaxID=400727 RepID=UPI000D734EBE|nr:uncharacterized protein LOC112574800 isoform X2 [Pomacea canaliculata]
MHSSCYRRQQTCVAVVVLIFSLLLVYTASVSDKDVTCEAPSVEPLVSTSVICHFPEDVSQTRRIISVSINKGKTYRDEKDILDCYWLSGKRECRIMLPGYSFNGTISHSLTLEIPRVSTEHMGKYACKLSSMDPDNIKPCELKVGLVGKTKCDVRSVDQTSHTSLTCYFPENLNETRAGLSVYHHTSRGHKESVMSCRWKDESFNCTMANGYELDGSVTDHVTLTLPSASQRQRGKYSCHMTDQPSVSSQLCLFPLENDAAVNSSCSIPSVQEMESTTLTCRYGVDMNVTRRNFTVVHLDDVDILNCIWLNDQLDCTPAPGYQFNNTVTDHLVIGVPRASRDHNGTYACHVMGSDEENFAPCEFIITQVSDKHRNDESFLAVIVSSFVILILVSLLIFIIYKWKTRERLMEREHRPAVGPTSLHESTPMTRSSQDRGNDSALRERESETDSTDGDRAEDSSCQLFKAFCISHTEAPNKLRNVRVKIRVVFHLETTGLGKKSHILRIAAASRSKSFFTYVYPRSPIESGAEEVNKLSKIEGRLCKNKKPVDALTIDEALSEFLKFLGDKPVTLFAHNCRKFSAPILLSEVTACNMLEELKGKITGFVDTLYLFRHVYPGLLSYRQSDLYKHFFRESYQAHEGMNDVTSLQRLLDLPRVTRKAVKKNSFGFDDIPDDDSQKEKNSPSQQAMVASGSVGNVGVAAASGLGDHLRPACKEDDKTGVLSDLRLPNCQSNARMSHKETYF